MSMLAHNYNQFEDMETLKTMYGWLRSGYKQIEKRLAETMQENEHLKQMIKEKNLHPFMD